jgi:hypothetical protein
MHGADWILMSAKVTFGKILRPTMSLVAGVHISPTAPSINDFIVGSLKNQRPPAKLGV